MAFGLTVKLRFLSRTRVNRLTAVRPDIIHSIKVCLTALALPLLTACSHDEPMPQQSDDATLYRNIATIEQSRANESALPDNEKM